VSTIESEDKAKHRWEDLSKELEIKSAELEAAKRTLESTYASADLQAVKAKEERAKLINELDDSKIRILT
jgi:hypothetical protein